MVDGSRSGLDGTTVHRIPSSKSELRSLVASMIGGRPEDVGEHENLIEYGIDSLCVLRIVGSWHVQGLRVKFCELSERPTIAEWWALVGGRTVTGPAGQSRPRVDPAAPFGLSPAQRVYRADEQIDSHVYLEIDGSGVDADDLRDAVRTVAERHPMLRACFLPDGTQQILPKPEWTGLTRYDLRGLDEAMVHRELDEIRSRLSHRKLDVRQGEVFDVRLSLLPGGRTRMHIELDPLVADVLSLGVFLDDLAARYAGGPETLRPLTYSFPQYRADLERSRGSARARDREYWMSRVADLPPAPRLPLAVDPARVERPVFRRLAHWLDPDHHARLVRMSRRHQVTPAMVLATAFAEVLGRWSGQSRLLLTLPLSDRMALHADVASMIGDFTSLVPLDVDLTAKSFVDRVRAVQRRFQADISHSAYSGVEVLHDMARHLPVAFTGDMGGGELLSRRFRESFGELGYMISQTPWVWLNHQLMEMDGGLYLNWDYAAELFPAGVVEAMFEAYRGVLAWVLDGDWSDVAPVELPESQRVVREVVGDTTELESCRLLHDAFFEWAAVDPDRVALVWSEDGEMSFGQLAEWSLRVAGALVGHGVRPGDAVAVAVRAGPLQVAAILGVLSAGGVYVPLGDHERCGYRERVMDAAKVGYAVVDAEDGEWPAGVRVGAVTCLDHAPLRHPVRARVADPAYVLPAGQSSVAVSHRSVVNTVDGVGDRFGIGADDRVFAVSPIDSDLAVYDIFGLLSVGGSVVLAAESEPGRWVELCRRHGVTVWNSTPSQFDSYLSAAEEQGLTDRLRLVLVSGERVGPDLPERFRQRRPDGRFIALGGATEAAIWSTACEAGPEPSSIPHGFPLRNQRCRVVDPAGRDCPDWVAGELWIGGLGVAGGYCGDPVRTAAKFAWSDGRRWYRTGEFARFCPDGTLELLHAAPS